MVQVYTSYFSKVIHDFRPDMVYAIVSNSTPKWWSEDKPVTHLKDFAPEWIYVQRLKNDNIEWQEFADQYKETLIKRFGTLVNAQSELLKQLNPALNASIVFLCWEKDHSRCHRTLLANMLFELIYNGELQ